MLSACGGGGGGDQSAATAAAGDGLAAPAPAPTTAAEASAPAPGATAAAPTSPAPALSPLATAAAPSTTAPAPAPAPLASSGAVPTLGDCELFPANNIFNTRIDDVSRFPAHPNSAAWVDLVGRNVQFHTDWGSNDNPANYGTYYGLPINVIDGTPATTDWPVVSFDFSTSGAYWETGWPFKSDCAVSDGNGYGMVRDCTSVQPSQRRFPFPLDWKLQSQGGACNDPATCGDKHVLVVEQGACRLWESYFAYKLGGQWYSLATSAWDLKSNAMRPDDWASSNAAGLPITPLLAKAAEANTGEIRHALSVAFRDSALALKHAWPGRFSAGGDNPGAIPFGAVLRLKADFVIPANWSTQAKAIATAAKRYGIYVSDNGADFHVGGEPNSAWNEQASQDLKGITMNDMEFVDLKSVTSDPRFSPDSMAASW
ncbi:hypothetical protein [Ramlibacter sp.]|uniref:hypothetical protein n=1 Tax=Ramlibacter sp. TaxID=1917967 RepID=UPI002C8102D8|nr:hypothetical protein [Ramlibacter sp.]HWI82292.1 hypothetical protein [Ramlibacter sp.]